MRRCLLFLLLLILTVGPLRVGRADDVQRFVQSGDEVDGDLRPGGVDAYLLNVVAGTDLRVELEADDDSQSTPTLVVLSPLGNQVFSESGDRVDGRVRETLAGTYRIEVRAGSYDGDYEIQFEAKLPESVSTGGSVPAGGSAVFLLDAPLHALVRIDVRRRSGAAPEVVAVRDRTGRSLPVVVSKSSRKRVRLAPLPVTTLGGFEVEVRGRDGGAGTYEVTGRPRDQDDDAPENEDDDRDVRRVVLQLAPGADAQALADMLGWTLVEEHEGYAVFQTPEGREGREDEDARTADEASDDVVGGEANRGARIPEGTQSNPIVLGSDLGRGSFDGQPAFQKIHTDAAHLRATGNGIVVAVLDTGIDATHSLLAGHVLPGYDYVDGDADPSEERNGLDDDGDLEIDEGFGHGTFVAGLVLGVAPEADILPVRVLDTDGRGTVSEIAAGIHFAVESGADVINLSLGMRARSDLLGAAVRFALASGVVVVASTGNGSNLQQVDFPGGVPGVSAVTAVNTASRRAAFANAGGRTGVAAPGVDLIGPHPGERWATWSGTSFATALVTGTSALVLERRPGFSPKQVGRQIRRRAQGLRGVPRAERKLLGGRLLDAGRAVR